MAVPDLVIPADLLPADGRFGSGPSKVRPEALAALAAHAAPDALAVATYDGVRGHPVLLGREHWAGVAESAAGDEGARRYLAAHAVTEVDCTGLADPTDLDVPPGVGRGGVASAP